MVKVEYDLPEGFDLVSVQRRPTGFWIICVKIVAEGEALGKAYGLGEGPTLEDAERKAIAATYADLEKRDLEGKVVKGAGMLARMEDLL